MKQKEIADRRNFLKESMEGTAGLAVASTTTTGGRSIVSV